MFTGIITEVGTIKAVAPLGDGLTITVEAPVTTLALETGASVSVNGACQTVVRIDGARFDVESVEETLKKTTFGEFRAGRRVNLEAPLRIGDRLGGHIVQGHVDGVGTIIAVSQKVTSTLFEIELPADLMRYVIPVGSISIDGISLTVASIGRQSAIVSIIPHTLENTTFGEAGRGDRVNIEVDLIGKYVARLMTRSPEREINYEQLRDWGYEG